MLAIHKIIIGLTWYRNYVREICPSFSPIIPLKCKLLFSRTTKTSTVEKPSIGSVVQPCPYPLTQMQQPYAKEEMVSETNPLRWRTTQAVLQSEKDIIPADVFGSDGGDRERKGEKNGCHCSVWSLSLWVRLVVGSSSEVYPCLLPSAFCAAMPGYLCLCVCVSMMWCVLGCWSIGGNITDPVIMITPDTWHCGGGMVGRQGLMQDWWGRNTFRPPPPYLLHPVQIRFWAEERSLCSTTKWPWRNVNHRQTRKRIEVSYRVTKQW